jgi:MSHA biogenesis protein MshQ
MRIDALAQGFLGTAGVNMSGRSPVIGRFYPDHLQLVSASLTPACNVFTYMDQPALGIDFTVEARIAGGALADNYFLDAADPASGYANVATTLVFAAEDADAGTDLGARVSVSAAMDWSGSAPAVPGQGVFQDALAAFLRDTAPDGPYRALEIGIELSDPDGVALINPDLDPDASGDCVAAGSCSANSLGTTDLRYGRVELRNSNGSELLPLTVGAYTSFFENGSFVVNTDDVCTTLAATAVVMANDLEVNQRDTNISVGAGSTTLSVVNAPAASGVIDLQLTAPGAGNTGYVDLTPDLSVATGAGLPWLEFDWDGNVATPASGPTGRATFGVFAGSTRQIYIRELFGQ